jgi:uncharacterized phosphosugar-binding protein
MCAARYSNTTSCMEAFELLINHVTINLNLKNEDGMTALMLAAMYAGSNSSPEVVSRLVIRGADLNIQSNSGHTALMYAAASSDSDSNSQTVMFLLESGADLTLKTVKGETALMIAAANIGTTSTIKTVREILDRTPDDQINILDNKGFSALLRLVANMSEPHLIDTSLIDLFVKKGANIHQATEEGNLFFAAIHSNIKIMEYVADLGVDIHFLSEKGNNALLYMYTQENIADRSEKAQFMLNQQIQINIKNKDGNRLSSYVSGEVKNLIKENIFNRMFCDINDDEVPCHLCSKCSNLNIKLDCGHMFHYMCMYDYLRSNDSCPVCDTVLY